MRAFRTYYPEVPVVGDWFRSTTVPLRFYRSSPQQAVGHCWSGMSLCNQIILENRLSPGSYIGPVHAVERSEDFVSVLVPNPEDSSILVWTNVWKRRGCMQIALLVDHEILQLWRQRGWVNKYLHHDS